MYLTGVGSRSKKVCNLVRAQSWSSSQQVLVVACIVNPCVLKRTNQQLRQFVVTLYSIAAPCALHGRSVLTTCTPCRSLCIHLVHTTQCNTYERVLGINRMVEISIQKCFGFKGSLQLQKCIKSGSKLFLYQFSHSCIALLSPK